MPERFFGDIFFTVSELAHLLGRSEKFARRHILNGNLVGKKVGRHWLIPAEELGSFINSLSIFQGRHRVKDKALQLMDVYESFLDDGNISQASYDQALKGLLSPSTGNRRIVEESLRLKQSLNNFLEKGDISISYYQNAAERLRYFLPGLM